MDSADVNLQLPAELYAELQALAAEEQTDPAQVIARLVAGNHENHTVRQDIDPVYDLIGAYNSRLPLIDEIPVSEDPDLYAIAASLGKRAATMHAWDIAPQRYAQGSDGRPVLRRVGGWKE